MPDAGRRRGVARVVAQALGVVALTVALLALAITLAGYDAPRALAALWRGSVGTSYSLFSATLVRATPLALAGLAVALAFRAGVLNIGAEGQLLAGAAAATAAATFAGGLGMAALPLVLATAAGAGAATAGIAALLRRRGVLEVISTLMLNFLALNLVGWLVRGPLQEPLRIYPQSPELPAAMQLPRLVAGTRLHLGFVIALAAALGVHLLLRHSASGFRIRVAGANPDAAASAGRIDVARTTARAFLLSGALAGLAGGIELTGVTFALYESISPGYGYTAIAVALLAGLHPLGVVASALLFGALEAGAGAMQRDAGVPATLVSSVEAVLILIAIAVASLRTRVPAIAGVPMEPAAPATGSS